MGIENIRGPKLESITLLVKYCCIILMLFGTVSCNKKRTSSTSGKKTVSVYPEHDAIRINVATADHDHNDSEVNRIRLVIAIRQVDGTIDVPLIRCKLPRYGTVGVQSVDDLQRPMIGIRNEGEVFVLNTTIVHSYIFAFTDGDGKEPWRCVEIERAHIQEGVRLLDITDSTKFELLSTTQFEREFWEAYQRADQQYNDYEDSH
ncbi:MAG: hypothetical protein GC162_06730 [Planctomycetes bacterium]|nr:hypothetical protein [Planctomycetota bacterium]